MSVRAIYKYARLSPQKARLVADQVRGIAVDKAMNLLMFSNKKAARAIKQTLRSAIANAEQNFGLDIDDLVVTKICVDQAPTLKRFSARAKGRSSRIIKQSCHITVEVA